MSATGTLDEQAYAHLTTVLRAWGMTPTDIEDTLRWATFGPGLVQMRSPDPQMAPGLGIVVDETQDEDLGRLFALRERLGDDELAMLWQVSPTQTGRIRVVLDPTGPQALLRYSVAIERPEQVQRHFLFLVHKLTEHLVWLQRPGTQLWLIPQHIAQGAPAGLTSAYEVISHCLPLGTTSQPLPALEKALAHAAGGAGRRR